MRPLLPSTSSSSRRPTLRRQPGEKQDTGCSLLPCRPCFFQRSPRMPAMIRFSCPVCQTVLTCPDHGGGRKISCPDCGQRLLIPPSVQVRNKTVLGEPMPPSELKSPETVRPPVRAQPKHYRAGYHAVSASQHFPHLAKVVCTSTGIGLGCIVGYFSAHYFAIFGGFLLLGEPHSPARDQLVPGHMLLWALLLGVAGLGLGFLMDGGQGSSRSRRPFAGVRTPSHRPGCWPTAIAVATLLSVLWLWVAALLARGPHWNGSPGTYASYEDAVNSTNRLDRALAPWKTDSSTFFAGVLLFSLAVSFVLVILSFCLWNRHTVPGRVLIIAASILLIPSVCCGLFL
jgi:hypothetical protein